MTKIVRLTESDLNRLVRKVINEQSVEPINIYDDIAETKLDGQVVLDGKLKKVEGTPNLEAPAHVFGYPEKKGKLYVQCGGQYPTLYFFEGKKITMSSHNRKIVDSFCSTNTKKPELEGVDCLLKAGFKETEIGGPVTRRKVYQKKMNGKTYQLDIGGGARVFNSDPTKSREKEQLGAWKCDPSSPYGIKFFNMKDVPFMPY